MAVGGESFPKGARLTRRSEFLALSRRGRKVYTPHFVVLTQPNDRGESRLGITVTKRVGNSVTRNLIKRRVREFFRRARGGLRSAEDFVIIAKQGAESLSLAEVTAELRSVLSGERKRTDGSVQERRTTADG